MAHPEDLNHNNDNLELPVQQYSLMFYIWGQG